MHEGTIEDQVTDEPPVESVTLDALERFSQFLDELHDTALPSAQTWEGNCSDQACRQLERVLTEWRDLDRSDRPPSDLIVRIVRKLRKTVEEIGGQPRKILQRQRSLEPLNRLRELDAACMQWLVKQPGRTLLQKTGNKRSLLVVQRFESLDTLENRVFIDFLRRAAAQAHHYLRAYEKQFPEHEWILQVRAFARLALRVLSRSEFSDISDLPAMPQPNYVLLHEPRYHQIWWGYQQLVRQHVRRRQLWRHRVRAWGEMLYVALLSSTAGAEQILVCNGIAQALKADIWIRERTVHGTKLSSTSFSPAWQHTDGRLSVIMRCGELKQLCATKAWVQSHTEHPICIARLSSGFALEKIGFIAPIFEHRNELTLKLNIEWYDPTESLLSTSTLEAPVNLPAAPSFFDRYITELLMS